jgi:predicted trehalose synthase
MREKRNPRTRSETEGLGLAEGDFHSALAVESRNPCFAILIPGGRDTNNSSNAETLAARADHPSKAGFRRAGKKADNIICLTRVLVGPAFDEPLHAICM